MRLEPGNVYPCCICGVGEIEIPEDADPDTLAMMNAGFERALARGIPEEECGLICEKCGEKHRVAGGKLGIGGILVDGA